MIQNTIHGMKYKSATKMQKKNFIINKIYEAQNFCVGRYNDRVRTMNSE